MNFINPLLARLQLFKVNVAMDDKRLHQALYHMSVNETSETTTKTPLPEAAPIQNPKETMLKTEDLYKLQALTQQEIIKRQLIENLLLRQQQESVLQILSSGSAQMEKVTQEPQKEEESLEKGDKISQKKIKKINTCGHVEKEHYAKGMCNNCYHRFGRNKKPWLCEHEKLYACGLCQNCYINKYNKKRRQDTESQQIQSTD